MKKRHTVLSNPTLRDALTEGNTGSEEEGQDEGGRVVGKVLLRIGERDESHVDDGVAATIRRGLERHV